MKTDSAVLKIDRAAKFIGELDDLFKKERPFAMVVQTNLNTGERFLFVRRFEAVVSEAAVICGDVVHNLRSALDHVFWEIVSPHCTNDQERRQVQFPFAKDANRFDQLLHEKFARRAGAGFFCAMRKLRAFAEPGGNELLYLVDEMNIRDKHKMLIPAVDYTNISREKFLELLPDWPPSVEFKSITFNEFSGKLRWFNNSVPRDQLGDLVLPSTSLFERQLDFPSEVVIKMGSSGTRREIIATLVKMVDTVGETVKLMRDGAAC